MHALENSSEILLNSDKIKQVLKNRFNLYLAQAVGLARSRERFDKHAIYTILANMHKGNESALILINAIIEHIFILKNPNAFKTDKQKDAAEISIDDFQNYLTNHLLCNSRAE
jgi:hypothetical protein